MDDLHRLLEIQNKSSFFKYKDYFCRQLKSGTSVSETIKKACEEFPELVEEFETPLRPLSENLKFTWLIYGSPHYPSCFYGMPDPPLILTMLGNPCWEEGEAISVVGSREPLSESLEWIEEELGAFAEFCKPVLVSGGARGVDQAVHALAIKKGLPTVAFLPSGLSEIYPSQFRSWVPHIIRNGGCVISEYPLGMRVQRALFHHRNRLIAQMGKATVIVQAAEKSGSIMTGHLAAEAGKPTWVVPAHPLRRAFLGNLKLLREGATMVCSAEDLSLFFKVETYSLNEDSAPIAKQMTFIN
jgi:DNA processing protein